MPIAAVPAFLGNDFHDASPGMRFTYLLPIWTTRQDQENEVNKRAQAKSREGQDTAALLQNRGMDAAIAELKQLPRNPLPGLWDKNTHAAKTAWDKIKAINLSDKARLKAIATRQTALAHTLPAENLLRLDALAIAPFTTGLGNEHPLENGFAFLNPYGLPYLPGSGVKGVLRQAARELEKGDWGDTHGWDMAAIDALFGNMDSNDARRGALIFWDVIPQIAGDHLAVEIMTPHQGHYYQQKAAAGSTSPHDSGQPIPISFLTVPPKSGFVFHVQCELAFLHRIAPPLAADGRWKELLSAAFEHAFQWLGFGAKTAVGYGAMKTDQAATQRRAKELADRANAARQEQEAKARQAARDAMTPAALAVQDFIASALQRQTQLGKGREKPNTGIHSQAQQLAKAALESADWSADEKCALAEALETWLPLLVECLDRQDDWKNARKKLKLAALKGQA